MDVDTALSAAKVGILTHKSVFLSTILFSLKYEVTPDVPTAGTDGVKLLINPDWFLSLTHRQRVGLLAHEAWHVAFDHMGRVGDRDKRIFNIAADIVINGLLLREGFELPPDGAIDKTLDQYTAEVVYEMIKDDQKTQNQELSMEDLLNVPDEKKDQEAAANRKQQVENTLIRAALMTKQEDEREYGNLPGHIKVMLEKLTNPRVNWRQLLARYLTEKTQQRHNFLRPSRRFMPDFYLPTINSPALQNITIAVDTSCSVSDKQFTDFISEISNIHLVLKPEKITIISFDTNIKEIQEVTRYSDIANLSFTGRGGTSLFPLFTHLKDAGNKEPLIVFSDLECKYVTEVPNYPVIWAIHTRMPVTLPKFGNHVYLEDLVYDRSRRNT